MHPIDRLLSSAGCGYGKLHLAQLFDIHKYTEEGGRVEYKCIVTAYFSS